MQTASHRLDHWPSVIRRVSSLLDLDASARHHKALLRKRGVRSAADLLHLGLLYGPGGLSLRSVASHATEAGIAELGDVSLLDRLRQAGDFFADVLGHLLADVRGEPSGSGCPRLSLVDGSTVSRPGSDGSDWRLHARYEPAHGGFTDLLITEARTAEALCCVAVRPGDVMVKDRGYARVRNFVHARASGADFITRIGWRSVRLFNDAGQAFDLLAALPASGEPVVEHAVRIGAARTGVPARLIIARKPPDATERQQARLHRKASRKGHKTDPRTLQTAGFMMLLTSLDAHQVTASEVVRLYRMRWQIELAFKRLKSLARFAELRARDPRLARAWLLAHLIAAVLIETSLGEGLDSPPWAAGIRRATPAQPVARLAGGASAPATRPVHHRASADQSRHARRCRAPPQRGATTAQIPGLGGQICAILAPMGQRPLVGVRGRKPRALPLHPIALRHTPRRPVASAPRFGSY